MNKGNYSLTMNAKTGKYEVYSKSNHAYNLDCVLSLKEAWDMLFSLAKVLIIDTATRTFRYYVSVVREMRQEGI